MAYSEDRTYQVAVIGAGPGGYAAAFQAAEHGLSVCLVNAEADPGGVCLLRGCIPSKALLHVARLLRETREASAWGIKYREPMIELEALREWKNGVVRKLAGGVAGLSKRRSVEYFHARATFADSATLHLHPVEGGPEEVPEHIHFENCILASGSRPAVPDLFRVGDSRVWTSTEALDLETLPENLLVIGGGYIGLEMGTVYSALGSKVTVVELLPNLLPGADQDLVRPLQKRLNDQFLAIHTNTRVEGLESRDDGILVRMKGEGVPEEKIFDNVLVSVGRWPNSGGLGLEDTRVDLTRQGYVKTDTRMRTDDPRILAIGDVTGQPMLAHRASRQGKVAAEVLAGEPSSFDNAAMPAVVFTDPEIAWTGLTETEAKEKEIPHTVARFPWGASGRALAIDRSEGMTKLLLDPETERVLGVGIAGIGAGELIAEATLAVENALTARDVAETIHPHPTLSETFMEAAEAFFGMATHLYRPRK